MPKPTAQAAFWTGIARKYAAGPIRDVPAWEATLARVAAHLPEGAEVLELGCGTGTTALRLAPHAARYVATDDAEGMIEIARERLAEDPVPGLTFATGRTGDGSLPSGPFDAVTAFNLLHLVPDLDATLAEVRGLLKPGGLLITKTPCLGGIYGVLWPVVAALRLMGRAPPVRFLTPRGLEARIVAAGFAIVERGDYPARPPSRFVVARL